MNDMTCFNNFNNNLKQNNTYCVVEMKKQKRKKKTK